DWDRRRFPPSPDLVVFELATRVPPQSLVRVVVDQNVPSPAGTERPPTAQSYALQVEPALFVNDVDCRAECDPDQSNSISLTGTVLTASFGKSLTVTDITEPGREKRIAAGSKGAARNDRLDRDARF